VNKFFRIPFAATGDRAPIPDTSAGTDVNATVGYGPSYQGDLDTDPTARFVERDKMNQLLYDLTLALQELQTFGGASDFITSSQNNGVAYSYAIGARVKMGGLVYESLVGSNTTTPPSASWMQISAIDIINVPGSYMQHAGPPQTIQGYIYCNGQAVSRTTYQRLYQKIGVTYGAGDGATTFNVPDRRGLVGCGLDDGRGLDTGRALGAAYQSNQYPSHSHTASSSAVGNHRHNGNTENSGLHTHGVTISSDGAHAHSTSVSQSGDHEHGYPGSVSGVNLNAGAAASHQGYNGPPGGTTLPAGDHSHTVTVNQSGSHAHSVILLQDGYHSHYFLSNYDGGHDHTITVNASGSGTEVRMANFAECWYIKT